ncbi:MAG: PQQ-binding-like beta-propeller repeat protein [Euryarchaeota archaeon]|nr:PQQ-binding-like beta-propeller repeat protein [Euryarchaeota archaeon]
MRRGLWPESTLIVLVVAMFLLGPASPVRAATPLPSRTVDPSGPLAAASPLPLGPGWSMYHGDPMLSGVARSSSPQHPSIRWSISLPIDSGTPPGPGNTDPPFQSSPIVAHGEVFVPTDDVLYLVNASTGVIDASIDLLGSMGDGPLVSTPLLTGDGRVAVAQDGGGNNVGIVDPGAGTVPLVCNFNGNPMASSLAPMPNDQLLQADTSGNINAVDLAGNACGAAGFNKAPGGPSYRATPSVLDVNTKGWEAFLPDRGSGKIDVWSVPAGGGSAQINLPPNAAGLFGSMAAVNITNGTQCWPTGFLANDAGAGTTSLLWAVNLTSNTAPSTSVLQMLTGAGQDAGVVGTPTVVDRGGAAASVYFGNNTGNLSAYLFHLVGGGKWQFLWNFSAGARSAFLASPAYSRGNLIDGATNGWLYDINASTGQLTWKVPVGAPFFGSPAVSGETVYAFAADGRLIAVDTAAPPVILYPPSPTTSGATTTVAVWVGAISPTGQARGNLSGATIALSASGGSIVGTNPAVSNGSGWAHFNWTTPSGLTGSINCTLTAGVTARGYAPAQAAALGEVDKALPTYLLRASVAAGSSTVALGSTTWVKVSAIGTGGGAVGGAAVQLSLAGAGSLASTFGSTAGNGTFLTRYMAPATSPSSGGVLIEANVSAPGYRAVQNATVLEIVSPAPTPFALSIAVTPSATLGAAPGGQVPFELIVTNTSSSTPTPRVGASVALMASNSLGTLSGSTSTSAWGVAYENFTAGSTVGSMAALAQVSAPGFASEGAALAFTISSSVTAEGSLHLEPAATPPFSSGSTIALNLSGTAISPSGSSSPAYLAVVTVSIAVGSGALSASSFTLNLQGFAPSSLSFTAPVVSTAEHVVLLFTATANGYLSTSQPLDLLILPQSLTLAPSFSSSDFSPGSTTSLLVEVTSHGNTVGGVEVFANVSESGFATPTSVAPSSTATSTSGAASFTVAWSGAVGETVELELEARGPGYLPSWNNVTVTLVAPPSKTPAINGLPLSLLDLFLLALALVFFVAFVVAIARRRRPSSKGSATATDEEAPNPPPEIEPSVAPGPPVGAGATGAIPPHEFDEELDHHETHPVATPTEEVAQPGPPLETTMTPAQEEGEETGPVVVEESKDEEGSLSEPAKPTTSSEGSEAGGVHVEVERTLGEERPSVEEANPYGEEIKPEDVNPNVHRIPKELLQPAEMRISGDEKAGDKLPEVEEAERQRADDARREELVEKSRRLKRARRPAEDDGSPR